jgi:hypothetical protein
MEGHQLNRDGKGGCLDCALPGLNRSAHPFEPAPQPRQVRRRPRPDGDDPPAPRRGTTAYQILDAIARRPPHELGATREQLDDTLARPCASTLVTLFNDGWVRLATDEATGRPTVRASARAGVKPALVYVLTTQTTSRLGLREWQDASTAQVRRYEAPEATR